MSDFFDMLGEKSQTIANSVKDTVEITRIRNSISKEEKNKEEVFAQMGKKYYELYANEQDEEFLEFLLQIKKTDELIEEYNKQIAEVKGEKVCPNCGEMVEKDDTFCSKCGEKME